MTNERQAALEKLANDVMKAHVVTASGCGYLPDGPFSWPAGSTHRTCALYLADNPGELARIRAEIEAEREPTHRFPESDDDLEGEMFEDDGVLIVKEGPAHGMRMCCNKDGTRWAWRTVSEIRACKPLGPSPRKRRLQALERVAKASSAYFTCDGEDKLFVKTALRQALADLEALEASE